MSPKKILILSWIIVIMICIPQNILCQVHSAEMYIKSLKNQEAARRNIKGVSGVAVGTLLTSGGILSKKPSFFSVSLPLLAYNGYLLTFHSTPAEIAYEQLQDYQGDDRKKFSELALKQLSERAKYSRYINASIHMALATYLYFLYDDNEFLIEEEWRAYASIPFAIGLIRLLLKSPSEKGYKHYLIEKSSYKDKNILDRLTFHQELGYASRAYLRVAI